MSEPSTNTPAPDGLIGLATNQGALQADLKHHVEDNNRTINELRSEQAERDEGQDQRITDVETLLTTVLDRLDTVLAAIETTSRSGGTKPKNTTADTPPTPPTRDRGESNSAYFKRLDKWAADQGVDAPPKPKGGPVASSSSYDRAVSEWSQSLAI